MGNADSGQNLGNTRVVFRGGESMGMPIVYPASNGIIVRSSLWHFGT